MNKNFYAPPKEVAELFSLEWRRAKRILRPFLDRKKCPKLYMAKKLSGATGMHYGGRATTFAIRVGRGMRYVRNQNVIALKEGRDMDEMKHTIRHEIVHCIHQNHKSQFKNALRGLEREREIEEREFGIKLEPTANEMFGKLVEMGSGQ